MVSQAVFSRVTQRKTVRFTFRERKLRLPPLTLIIGGASSGKSAFAERLVAQSGLAKVYVATAEAHDDEMRAKIAEHRTRRIGKGWRTIEAPLDLEPALARREMGEVALIDCITLWLTNQMLAEADLAEETDALIDVLDQVPVPVVIVTNDVSGGIVPENAMARAFRTAQGRLNQRLAARADLVMQITAGLPTALKGAPPAVEEREGTADESSQAPHSGSRLW
jgi:adenosylcobinamide kinase/adenosylcobinamide-phosphate guanylyltransferase